MSKDLKIGILLDYYGDMLTKSQRELSQMYYNDDLSLSEIAELTGITRQGVYDSVKRSEAVLLELEEKLKLLTKEKQTDAQFEHILKLCSKISDADDIVRYVEKCLKERMEVRSSDGV